MRVNGLSGESSTYEQLIQPIESAIIQTIWRIVRNAEDTDDALQEALSLVWKRLERIRRHPNPRALILKICADSAHDFLRKRLRHQRRLESEPEPEAVESSPMASERLIQKEMESEILDAIARLPPKQATAIFMRLVRECSYGEIAEVLDCSETTARIHVSKGRERLGRALIHLFSGKEEKTLL